jgi:hypothetical protein
MGHRGTSEACVGAPCRVLVPCVELFGCALTGPFHEVGRLGAWGPVFAFLGSQCPWYLFVLVCMVPCWAGVVYGEGLARLGPGCLRAIGGTACQMRSRVRLIGSCVLCCLGALGCIPSLCMWVGSNVGVPLSVAVVRCPGVLGLLARSTLWPLSPPSRGFPLFISLYLAGARHLNVVRCAA